MVTLGYPLLSRWRGNHPLAFLSLLELFKEEETRWAWLPVSEPTVCPQNKTETKLSLEIRLQKSTQEFF